MLRIATVADRAAIEAVMIASARQLSEGFYGSAQVPSFVAHVALLDPVLIADGTYFVIVDDGGAVIACGGRRGVARRCGDRLQPHGQGVVIGHSDRGVQVPRW